MTPTALLPGSPETSGSALSPCARCAQVQRTCCQRAEILVTQGDLLRIGAHTGHQDFWEYRVPADPAYREPDAEDPLWLTLTTRPDGSRRMLRRQAEGSCTFLGSAGCVLPEGVRPLVCRLYPLAYTEQGLQGSEAEYCPTALLARPGQTMAQVLGMSPATAESWRRQLYGELHHGTP